MHIHLEENAATQSQTNAILFSLLGALGFKRDGKAPSQNPADDTEKNRLGERTIGAILYLVGQTYSEY